MDKNKNRTDLLAAGRKKLQQYRQKKDNKGSSSHGKSLKKSSKSELHEADADAVSVAAKPPPQVLEGEIESQSISDVVFVDSSVSNSLENSSAPNIDVTTTKDLSGSVPSEKGIEDTEFVCNAKLPREDLGTGEAGTVSVIKEQDVGSFVPKEEESTLDIGAGVVRTASIETSEIAVSEGGSIHADMSFSLDADATSTAAKPMAVPKEGTGPQSFGSDVAFVDSSVSNSLENSSAPDIDIVTINPLPVSVPLEKGIEEMGLARNAGFPTEDSGAGEAGLTASVIKEQNVDSFVPKEGESTLEVGAGVARTASLETPETISVMNHDMSLPVELLAPPVSVDATEGDEVIVQPLTANKNEGELLSSQQGFPGMALIPREDQVTDVGAMQEADSLGSKQLDISGGIKFEDGGHALSQFAVSAGTVSGKTVLGQSTCASEQFGGADDVSASAVEDRRSDGAARSSCNEEISEMHSISGDFGSFQVVEVQADTTDWTDHEVSKQHHLPEEEPGGESCARPLGTKTISLSGAESSGEGVNSISLLQLADMLKGLNEDDLRFLIKSSFADVLEMYKEQLYLTNVAKEFFQLQLIEQSNLHTEINDQGHQLDDETSMPSPSFDEVRGRNNSLTEELARCQSEFQSVSSEREQLQNQFHTAKAEIEEFSAIADEFQIKLERSQGDLLSLSSELADCKGLVLALQAENANLIGSFTSVTEERKKLDEEKGHFVSENEKLLSELADFKGLLAAVREENYKLTGSLASVTDARKNLEEEKVYFVRENEKLSRELADCKDLLESARVEIANLTESLASVTEGSSKLGEEKEYFVGENEKLLSQLAECKSFLKSAQVEIANLSGSLASMTEESKKVEEEKEYFVGENKGLLSELAECKGLVEAGQLENAKVTESIALMREERKKLEEEKEHIVHENEGLSSELRVHQDLLSVKNTENLQLEADLRESNMRLEQLTEENVFLISSLEIHKAKIREVNHMSIDSSSQSRGVGNLLESSDGPRKSHENAIGSEDSHQIPLKHDGDVSSTLLEKPMSDGVIGGLPLKQPEREVYDDSFGFAALKGHLAEAEEIVQELGKAIEGMHSHAASLSRSGGKVATLGVSKLIQAFESKAHFDDHEVGEKPLTEVPSAADPFMLSRDQTGSLRAVLKELELDAENAAELFRGERDGRKLADVALRELQLQYEAMKTHTSNLEAKNIQLEGLYESTTQRVCNIEAKKSELEDLYESLKQQDINLKAENCELGKKINDCQSRISKLQIQLHEMQQSSDEMVSSVSSQLENLEKESAEKVSELEHEWNSTVAQIVETIGKLDASIGSFFTSSISIGTQVDLDVGSRVASSVNAATKVIKDLQEKLEANRTDHESICSSYEEMNEKFNDLHGKNELMVSMLRKIYVNLWKLVNDSCGDAEDSEINIQNVKLLDTSHFSNCETLMGQLDNFLGERLHLESENSKLNSELLSRTKAMEELNQRCLDLNAILRLVEDVEGVVKQEDMQIDSDKPLVSRLEYVVSFLLQKYKEADEQLNLSREEFGSKMMKVSELQESIHELNSLNLQRENEVLCLKESLSKAEEILVVVRFELQEKVTELEQSEQRVASVREKLSIAVAKGKGLVVQRDGLKQSLAETSNELERCSQELQLKDARLHEVETKLKTYSEAGERVEALESELSYIRNSATALRESFLLKDSLLQRIEEILEDLELPEHFHSRDIIEKVDWLARAVTGNSLPLTDWDQKSSMEGGSYSDAGFVAMDGWKEDLQPSSIPGDDMKRKYEELQSKFYGLAEQTEMLEQSLMERNNLVQRWEQVLDRINMPTQLRSMEPEDRIEWLGTALSEAHHHVNSLQQKIDNLEAYCDNVTADLEESQRRLSDIEAALQMAVHEKENLFKNLEISTRDHEEVSERAVQIEVENDKLRNEIKGLQEKVSERAVQFEVENDKLQKEIKGLQEELAEKLRNEEYIHKIEAEIQRLQDLIGDTLQDAGATGMVSGGSSIECLEGLLRKLLEKYTSLSLGTPVQSNAVEEHVVQRTDATPDELKQRGTLDAEESEVMVIKKDFQGALGDLVHVMEERDSYVEKADATLDEPRKRDMLDAEESEVVVLKKELQEALGDLLNVKEERDSYAEKHQSLAREFEALNRRREELQELLSQEEQKSASAKEKLNVAVRRGKSLVQQRDSLKQTIEELSSKVEELKSEINLREDALAGYEQKIKDLSPYQERVTALESECAFLSNRLTQTEHYLQEKGHSLSIVLNTLGEIDVGTQINTSDPVEKLEKIGKLCRDLDAAVITSEQEARKSKRAAELLLAELNEVQERNDGLQEELVKAGNELVELTRERDMAEAAKHEALSKRENEYAEFMVLRSGVDKLKKDFSDINSFLVDIFSMDLGFLHNLEAGLESCLEPSDVSNVVGVPFVSAQGGVASNSEVKENFLSRVFWSGSKTQDHFDDNVEIEVCSFIRQHLQEFTKEVGALKEKLHMHSNSYHEKASSLSNVMGLVHRKIASQKESLESTKRDISSLELIVKEKDTENVVMHRSIALLYEACTDSIMEIENRRAHLVRNNLAAGDLGADLKSADGLIFSGQTLLSSEERVKTMADKLLLTVKEFASIQADIVEGNQLEMKATIATLHKELQEKDIQKDRICMELVSQIKEADAAAKSYSQELQSTKARVHELEKRVEVLEEERNLLEQRVKDLQDGETASMELKEKVRSMTDVLASKDQEIESLMQALDEEETQMEELTNKIANLEKNVHQKNVDLENLKASRGKALKKLSITVTRFDELHQLSASLLAEVEKLQSQVQDRDSEISFLRQEVTRCTGDVLVASQMSSKRSSDEIHELLTWLEKMVSQVGAQDVVINDTKSSPRIYENKELLQKQITFIMSELVDLRAVAQSKDALLQVERSRVEELQHKEEALEISLHEKESQLKLLQGAGNSEILEVEPVMNKWASGTSITPQVRSLRKVNNDQVAIAIDDPGTSRLEDEDDDKVHGFKSLTTSRIVPRFTRPVTDMVDGLWVSCDRALMRQPALRLGIMIYWAILHALLAAFVV